MARCTAVSLLVLALTFSSLRGQNVTFEGLYTTNVNSISVSEGEKLTVCVEKPPNIQARVVATVKGSPPEPTSEPISDKAAALGGLDYTPEELELVFEASVDQETKCSEFSITQDGLDEVSETFILSLSFDNEEMHSEPVEVSITACTAGDVLLRQYTPRPEYSAVEYCHSSETWITLCDDDWTNDDTEVICRQAGKLGGTTTNYRIGLPIHNERQNVPICIGNESKIDDCLNNSTYNPNRCLPVLINCGTDDRGQGNNRRALAAAVTVPLLFVIFGVVAAGTIAAVFLWKKGLLQWESCIRPKRFRNRNNRSINARNSTTPGTNANHNNMQFAAESAEYTAPFTGPVFNKPKTTPTAILKKPKPAIYDKDHYEGCDMVTLTAGAGAQPQKPNSRRPRSSPGVAPKPPLKKSDAEDYSHLHHK